MRNSRSESSEILSAELRHNTKYLQRIITDHELLEYLWIDLKEVKEEEDVYI